GFDGGPVGPYYSNDGGSSWSSLPGAFASLLLVPYDVEFIDNTNMVVTNLFPPGTFKGIRIAGQWQFFKTDSTVSFTDVEIGASGTMYTCTLGDGIYKSTTSGNSWSSVNTNLKAFLAYPEFQSVSHFAGETLFAASLYSTPIFKTTNGGLTWQEIYNSQWINKTAIEIYKNNPNIVYMSAIGAKISLTDTLFFSFYRSSDGGANWTPIDTINNPDTSSFNSLWVSPSDSSRLLAVSPGSNTDYLVYSTDAGQTWTQLFSNVNSKVTGTDTVFVQVNDTVFVSFDKGTSWQSLVTSQNILEMSYNPENKLLYAVRQTGNGDSLSSINLSGSITNIADVSGGLHSLSTPGGNDIYLSFWTNGFIPLFARSSDGGQTFDVDTLAFLPTLLRASPNEILLADLGKSFRRSTDAVGISSKPKKQNSNFNINITPQVFKNSVKITLALPRMDNVKITIYDIDGRLIKNVTNRVIKNGTTSFEWNGENNTGKNMPSGIYFVKLTIGENPVYTGKVVKLR
ncbi:MAG: hypothetical protein B5M53_02310, partial [Candidatus Cloacimonas sp. 4484_209]